MIIKQLQNIFSKVLDSLGLVFEKEAILIEIPKNPDHGDYATNIAMRLAKFAKKSPLQIAQDIVQKLEENPDSKKDYRFSIIGGFINIKLTDEYLISILKTRVNNQYGQTNVGEGKKVLLEFVSANPTGPLHIGHGRWAAIGDVLARVMKHAGYAVSKEFYINDQGNQVQKLRESVEAVKKGTALPEDGYQGAYVKDLAKETGDPVLLMQEHQKKIMKNLGVEFDSWFSEKTLHESKAVEKALEILKKNNATKEEAGALWFKSTEYGDDKDRVLVRENGQPTYFAADVAYHENKMERGFDKLINIWGADHHGYVARVQAALQALTLTKGKGKLDIILGQLVTLYRNGEPVKMSKRTGEMITLEEVIEEIGSDAARYFLVSRSTDTQLDFDLEVAKKKNDENPVYYIQYAHARICSILRQAEANISGAVNKSTLEPLERKILLAIAQIPDELALIAQTYNIHLLTYLAKDFAKMFHGFYHEYRILSDNIDDTLWRLELIKAIKQVLAIILTLLGVSAPERM